MDVFHYQKIALHNNIEKNEYFRELIQIYERRDKQVVSILNCNRWYLPSENLSFGTCFESGMLNEKDFKNIQNSTGLYSLKKDQKKLTLHLCYP